LATTFGESADRFGVINCESAKLLGSSRGTQTSSLAITFTESADLFGVINGESANLFGVIKGYTNEVTGDNRW
jgi:hypothetical protein